MIYIGDFLYSAGILLAALIGYRWRYYIEKKEKEADEVTSQLEDVSE